MKDIAAIVNGQIDNIFKLKIVSGGTLRVVNRALVIIGLVLAGYLMVELIFVRPHKNITSTRAADGRSGDTTGLNPRRSAAPDYSVYAKELSGKNIFTASGAQGIGAAVASDDPSSQISLIGVIGGDPAQAIIEDKIDQKTYYLKKGESFGAYTVEDISDGVVVLDSGGSKTRLKL
jgi:hypothetical protein